MGGESIPGQGGQAGGTQRPDGAVVRMDAGTTPPDGPLSTPADAAPIGDQTDTRPDGKTSPDAKAVKDAPLPIDAPAEPMAPLLTAWGFETSTHLWMDYGSRLGANDTPRMPVTISKEQRHQGASSLKYTISTRGGDDQRYLAIKDPRLPLHMISKAVVNLWVPTDHKVRLVQVFVEGQTVPWFSVNNFMNETGLVAGGWSTFTLPIPEAYKNQSNKVAALGIELWTDGPWTGAVFIDDVMLQGE